MSNPANVSELAMENKKLTRQLELVLSALSLEDVDVPCPSTVGLDDAKCGTDYGECWKKALAKSEKKGRDQNAEKTQKIHSSELTQN